MPSASRTVRSFVATLVVAAACAALGQAVVVTLAAGCHDSLAGHVIGVVRNVGSHPVEFVQIVSSIYDASGEYLDSATAIVG